MRTKVSMTTESTAWRSFRPFFALFLLICVVVTASCGDSWRDDPARLIICKCRILPNEEVTAHYAQEQSRMVSLFNDYLAGRNSYRDLVVQTNEGILIPALTPAQSTLRKVPDPLRLAILPTSEILDAVPIAAGIGSIRADTGNLGGPAILIKLDANAIATIVNEVGNGGSVVVVNVWFAMIDLDLSSIQHGRILLDGYPDATSRDLHLKRLCSYDRHKPGWMR
jgi:hypothetical protein